MCWTFDPQHAGCNAPPRLAARSPARSRNSLPPPLHRSRQCHDCALRPAAGQPHVPAGCQRHKPRGKLRPARDILGHGGRGARGGLQGAAAAPRHAAGRRRRLQRTSLCTNPARSDFPARRAAARRPHSSTRPCRCPRRRCTPTPVPRGRRRTYHPLPSLWTTTWPAQRSSTRRPPPTPWR